ncbi:hypothetical protein Hanom_Chr02g00177651 [Helianthus anomalus]
MRACEVQSAPSKRHIAPHRPRHARARVRVRVKVLRILREDISECFHETMRMKRSYLNTPLSFISHPMWDKVPLSHLF